MANFRNPFFNDSLQNLLNDIREATKQNHNDEKKIENLKTFGERAQEIIEHVQRQDEQFSKFADDTYSERTNLSSRITRLERAIIFINGAIIFGTWAQISLDPSSVDGPVGVLFGLNITGLENHEAVIGLILLVILILAQRSWLTCKALLWPLERGLEVRNFFEDEKNLISQIEDAIDNYGGSQKSIRHSDAEDQAHEFTALYSKRSKLIVTIDRHLLSHLCLGTTLVAFALLASQFNGNPHLIFGLLATFLLSINFLPNLLKIFLKRTKP